MNERKLVLVVTPHPDDAESQAGGTIARWVVEGREVVLVVCTNGDKGTGDRSISSQALMKTRQEEQLASSQVLGLKDVVFLGQPDQGLEDTSEFREMIVRQIRLHKPHILLTVDPNRSYLRHRDPHFAGRVALDAVFPYARDHLSYPHHLAEGLEPHNVAEVYLWGSDDPDTFVDVTDTFDLKFRALYCHASQVGSPTANSERRMRARLSKAGEKIGSELAEGFKHIQIMRG